MRERKKENFCCWHWNIKVYNCGIKKVELSSFITYFMVIY